MSHQLCEQIYTGTVLLPDTSPISFAGRRLASALGLGTNATSARTSSPAPQTPNQWRTESLDDTVRAQIEDPWGIRFSQEDPQSYKRRRLE